MDSLYCEDCKKTVRIIDIRHTNFGLRISFLCGHFTTINR